MNLKTSSPQFEKYGSVYNQPLAVDGAKYISQNCQLNAKKSISLLYSFDCEICIEMNSGMAALLVGFTPRSDIMESFVIHHNVKIKPKVYFSLVAITSSIDCRLIIGRGCRYATKTLSPPYIFDRIFPHVQIQQILAYFYSIRTPDYQFQGESHSFFELTYVDHGYLNTEVDGKIFELKEKELMIYGPNQFHTQSIKGDSSCSYVTILFDMETGGSDKGCIHYDILLNRVFHYDKKIYILIKSFVTESASRLPYMDSLLLCLLQEMLIRLLQSVFIGSKNIQPVSEVKQHYQNQLLDKILTYIEETIYEPITIAQICQKFFLSRSSLQILFKENLYQSPKKYISDLKLEKSRQIICENKYTITEIASMLGFNSVHYFSKIFTQKYHITPREYAKSLYKK